MASFQDLQASKAEFFKKQRQQVGGEAERAKQEASDAMTRRFAALGAQGSGAAVSAQLKTREMGEAQKQRALEGVAGQELQSQQDDLRTQMAMEEAEKGRLFSASEAEKQREFGKKEGETQRQFQERMANKDMELKREMFGFEQGTKLKELDLAKAQFDLDAETTDFNKRLALAIQGIQRFDKPIEKAENSSSKTPSQPDIIQTPSQPNIMQAGRYNYNMDQIAIDLFGNEFDDLPQDKQNEVINSLSLWLSTGQGNRASKYRV